MEKKAEKEKSYLYIHRTQGRGVEGVHIKGIYSAIKLLGFHGIIVSPDGVFTDIDKRTDIKEQQDGNNNSNLSILSKHLPEIVFEILEILSNIVLISRGKKVLNRNNISFIYERYAIFGVTGVFLARKYRIPFILELNYTSKSDLVRNRSRIFKPLAFYLEKKIFSKATGIAAVSTQLKRQLIEEYSIHENKILVTPNAVDIRNFSISSGKDISYIKKIAERKIIIGFVGGFYPWHGLHLLIEAYEEIATRNEDVLLMLVGDGPERKGLEHLVRQKNLGEKVIFTGKVEHHEIPIYMAKFNIGVMPNSNDYGSPMKIFEYMALNKPYVAPDYPPILEVTEGQGMIFEKNDVKSFVGALEYYIHNPQKMLRDGENGRKLVETKYNWLENAKSVLSLIESDTK